MKVRDRLLHCQNLRQMALDLINSSGKDGMLGPDVVNRLGWVMAPGSSRLQKMAKEGELRREREVMFVPNGEKMRKQNTWRYFALVIQTKQAEDAIKSIGRNLKARNKSAGMKKKNKPGHYIHNNADRPCIPNQGGQGRASPRMCTYLEANS